MFFAPLLQKQEVEREAQTDEKQHLSRLGTQVTLRDAAVGKVV